MTNPSYSFFIFPFVKKKLLDFIENNLILAGNSERTITIIYIERFFSAFYMLFTCLVINYVMKWNKLNQSL